ncbi:MAG TPA: DJ-1/PfpI family protein [Pseudonocardiaceae bacterium]|nr:DJ-1/PfpI family protein [Pseudonocardiaceae bacterium]
MQIAILLYDGLTALDAIGPYEVLQRLPDSETITVGEHTGIVRTDTKRLGLAIDATLDDIPHPDIVVVPGGPGNVDHTTDGPVQQWLRTIDATTTWTTSVCTGSLILAAAGLLTGRRATTYWSAIDKLADHGAIPTRERVVIDGKYVTGAGVSAGIDMALTLAAHIAGDTIAQRIQLGIEYDPQPPFNSGSPTTAPPEVLELIRR